MARQSREELKHEIATLKSEASTYETQWSTEREALELKITNLEAEKVQQQERLNDKALKKLAEAYSDQEEEFEEENIKWLRAVAGALLVLLVSIGLSTWLAHNQPWNERFEYYLVDFVFVTFLIFSMKQYSLTSRLRVDFANRKTLAQSYQNIISTAGEDTEIKEVFLSKLTEILCAPATDHKPDSYTVPEKALETAVDMVSKLKS